MSAGKRHECSGRGFLKIETGGNELPPCNSIVKFKVKPEC